MSSLFSSAPPSATTLLLDASNMIVQVFQKPAVRDLSPAQTRQEVVRNISRRIRALHNRYGPDYVLAAIDHERSFRRELDPAYKSKRKEKPQALKTLLQASADIMWEAGALPLHACGFEADDVLATLAAHAPGQTIIYTNDSDLDTVVSSRVRVHRSTWEQLGEAQVQDKHNLKPSQIVLYKALVGDRRDNFTGVKRLRDAQALALARTYATMDDLLGQLEQVPEPVQSKLRAACPERLRRNYTLCKLVENAPVQPALNVKAAEVRRAVPPQTAPPMPVPTAAPRPMHGAGSA